MNSDINEIKISASDWANDNSAEWMHFESETLLIENSKMPFVDHRVWIMLLYPVMTNFNIIIIHGSCIDINWEVWRLDDNYNKMQTCIKYKEISSSGSPIIIQQSSNISTTK